MFLDKLEMDCIGRLERGGGNWVALSFSAQLFLIHIQQQPTIIPNNTLMYVSYYSYLIPAGSMTSAHFVCACCDMTRISEIPIGRRKRQELKVANCEREGKPKQRTRS